MLINSTISSLHLYYTGRGKEAISHPISIPLSCYPLPLHGATLPEIGHVFLSSGVNENI